MAEDKGTQSNDAAGGSADPRATKPQTRFVLKTLLYFSALIVLVLGTLVIFTFDPCIDPSSTLAVCR